MGECRECTKSLFKHFNIVIRKKVSNDLYLIELPLSALSNRCFVLFCFVLFFNCLKIGQHTRYQAQTDETPEKLPKTSPQENPVFLLLKKKTDALAG